MVKRIVRFVPGAVAVVVGLIAFGTVAHQGADGIVKVRMDTMKAIAVATKTIADMMKGETPFDTEKAAQAADVIADHAREIPALFPPGSNPPPSETLDAVWQDWENFRAIAADLVRAGTTFAEEARNGTDRIRPHFAEIASSCGACHKDYRRER